MKKEIQVLVLEDVAADVVMINHELRKAGLPLESVPQHDLVKLPTFN